MPDLAVAPPPAAPSAPSAPPAAAPTPVSTPASTPGREQAGAENRDRLRGRIGDMLRAAETPAAEPETVAEPAVEELIQQVEEPPVEAEPVVAEPAAEGEIVETTDDEEIPFDTGKPEWLPDDKWKTVYSGYKLARELSKPLDQGGIGFSPTVEEARLFYDAYAERIAMEDQFASGQPADAANFVNQWFGAQENGQARQNAEMVAEAIPYVLARNNEAAYARLAKPVLDGYRNEMWSRWQNATDKTLKDSLWQAAQAIEFDLTGKYREFDATGKPVQPAADPNRQAIDAEWQRINAEKQSLTNAQRQRWDSDTNAKIVHGLMPQIDTALAPLKKISAKAPAQYKLASKDFHDQVVEQVKKDAKFSSYVSAWKTASRSGRPEDQEDAVALYHEMADRAIKVLRRPFLEGWGLTQRQQSEARHAELNKIATTAEPNSAGAPTGQVRVPSAKAPVNETSEEKMKRRIREISASAGVR